MSAQSYERLSIEDFGRQTILSGDLDPVYIALAALRENGDMTEPQLYRWLLAYWCYYHCGFASWICTIEKRWFWNHMMTAAKNEIESPVGGRWPRAKERRHARGSQAIKMVTHLRERYGSEPERMVADLVTQCTDGIHFSDLSRAVVTHTLFGPWIAFKVGDMLERVCGCPVSFANADVFMFKDPTKAAIMLYKQKAGLPEDAKLRDEGGAIREVVDYLKDQFVDLRATPRGDRPIDLQEVETVLCKWKSHMNGHYPLNNDLIEIRQGLIKWGAMAEKFNEAMPRVGGS